MKIINKNVLNSKLLAPGYSTTKQMEIYFTSFNIPTCQNFTSPEMWKYYVYLLLFYKYRAQRTVIPIRFVDFLFGEIRIYSLGDFSFIFSLIYDDFLIHLLTNYLVKNPHFWREGYCHILLCEEMIFTLPKGKNDWLSYEVIFFYIKITSDTFFFRKVECIVLN